MGFTVKFWGVRGSIPAGSSPDQQFKHVQGLFHNFFKEGYSKKEDIETFFNSLPFERVAGFGSDTSCVQVKSGDFSLLVDGGSGLRRYGQDILPQLKPGNEHHILLTHFHWDHLLGIPFFIPIFRPDQVIHFYAVQPDLEKNIRVKFSKPFFPVSFEMLGSKIIFHQMEPRVANSIGPFSVTPYQLDHPDPCWGFKIEKEGLTYSHCVDTEGTRVSREEMGVDLPLYQNVNLMYFDAQYTLPELVEKSNWGHSAAQIGLDIALREGIEMVVFGHHDPGASTKNLFDLHKQTKDYHDWRIQTAQTNRIDHPKVKWKYGYDGLEIHLGLVKNK